MYTMSNPGSTANSPDLGWSQVRETIAMLCLAMAQVEASLHDSNESVCQLTDSFTGMASDATSLCRLVDHIEPGQPVDADTITTLRDTAGYMLSRANQAIVAFQFYDRMTQKLSHVNGSLLKVADLIADTNRIFNPKEWVQIQETIKSNYTMECERLMFEQIMLGKTIHEALELYRHEFRERDKQKAQDDTTDDDIELF
ncbi:MAG TPA: hypothetical protein VFM46_06380 [Pseudomonadales bacterium]|nr:hypothetical protein [Pseudomonadales bacterium]